MRIVLYLPGICNRVSMASPCFALHYFGNSRSQNYNSIFFYTVTIFKTKKQKMFRYQHNINIVIHISMLFVLYATLFSTNLHGVLISCKFVLRLRKQTHAQHFAHRGGRARANACEVPRCKGRYQDKHTLPKGRPRSKRTLLSKI